MQVAGMSRPGCDPNEIPGSPTDSRPLRGEGHVRRLRQYQPAPRRHLIVALRRVPDPARRPHRRCGPVGLRELTQHLESNGDGTGARRRRVPGPADTMGRMPADHDYVERNTYERERLSGLVARLTDDDLGRPVPTAGLLPTCSATSASGTGEPSPSPRNW